MTEIAMIPPVLDRQPPVMMSLLRSAQQNPIPFADELTRATKPSALDQLREAAEQFVSSAFVIPALATMHESTFAEGPFAPGTAERRFQPMLDQYLADAVVKAAKFPIVDRIVDSLALKMNLDTGKATQKEAVDGAA